MFLIVSCSTDKKKAIEHYNKAKELYKIGDVKNADSEIEVAISLDTSNLDFQIVKAKIISETDNYVHAIKILTGLLARHFKVDTVNYTIGSCYFSYGNYFSLKQGDKEKAKGAFENAVRYYNYAINSNTQYYDAYLEKQKALHNLNNFDEALITLSTAISLFQDSMTLICNRGIEKYYLGDFSGAIVDTGSS